AKYRFRSRLFLLPRSGERWRSWLARRRWSGFTFRVIRLTIINTSSNISVIRRLLNSRILRIISANKLRLEVLLPTSNTEFLRTIKVGLRLRWKDMTTVMNFEFLKGKMRLIQSIVLS